MGLTNAEYAQIMEEYDSTRSNNRRIKEERYKEIIKKIPEYKEVEERIVSVSMQEALRRIASGKATDAGNDLPTGQAQGMERDSSSEGYRKTLQELEKRKTELLLSAGYDKDYLNDIYSCLECHDTGYVGDKKCKCFMKRAVDLVYRDSNLKNITEDENFDTFELSYYSNKESDRHPTTKKTPMENMIEINRKCREFVEDFDSAHGNMLFMGSPGIGKTFLINCIAKELLDSSHSVIYLTATELFKGFERQDFNRNKNGDENNAIFDDDLYLTCDLLVIDDLGTEVSNSYTNSRLFHVINDRMLRKKSVLISTNLSFPALRERYSERISSRLASSYGMYFLYGEDIRFKKKRN